MTADAMEENELMKVCSVGGNPVSAFLSWRLQATNACDVTLVWKAGYEHVSQYGISMKYEETSLLILQFVPSESSPNPHVSPDLPSLATNGSSLVMV